MALVKTYSSALSAVTTTQTSSTVDVSGSYASEVYAKCVQVGTATTAASFTVLCSCDTSTYPSVLGPFSAGLTAATYNFPPIAVPPGTSNVEVGFTQQAGGTSSTFTAQISRVTAL